MIWRRTNKNVRCIGERTNKNVRCIGFHDKGKDIHDC